MPLDTHTRPNRRRSLSSKILLGIVASLAAAPMAHAANDVWIGNTDANFATLTNWTGSVSPNNNTPVFGTAGTSGTTLNNDLTGATYAGLTFNSGASVYTIGGNSFTLSGNITNSSGSLQTINNAIALSTAAHTISAASGNIALSGAFSGASGAVTFVGPGTTTLSGTNTLNTNSSNFAGFIVGGTISAGTYPSGGASTGGNVAITGATTVDGTGASSTNGGLLDIHGASTLTIQTSGSLLINSVINATGNGIIGQNATGTSTLWVNGGSLTINGAQGFVIGNNRADATGVLTISSGTATINRGSTTATDFRSFISLGRDNATGIINLNGGVLATDRNFVRDGSSGGTAGSGTATFNFNGGVLQAQADQTAGNGWFETAATGNFQVVTTTVKAGGAKIDTNGFNTNINTVLAHDSGLGGTADGGLTKSGTGTLRLGAVNTYTGNTTINGGGLTLADNASIKFVVGTSGVSNKVVGSGAFTVDGDFAFDLAGASTTVGSSWQIVDVSTLTTTFGGTFTVTGFTLNAAKWVRQNNGAFYEFDPATGVLRVINDADISYPAPSATPGNYNTTYAVGSNIVLSVSSSGIGTLTYQWYYQADAGATPAAISGATASTFTVSAATGASSGIYSVIVTDHAAEASGKPATTTTATFSTISVLPASELAVAYYRFEEGTNGSAISSALDSVSGNNLTPAPLGAATYANASVPYATVPASGAANILGANFPASGNNGLVAPTSGTLAGTAFNDFTVEAFVRFSDLAGVQTLVGRDDVTTGIGTGGQGTGAQALFYLSKGSDNKFRVELITKGNTNIQINGQGPTVTLGAWYHVAVVGDALTNTLKLYVNGTQVGSVAGFNGLFLPTAGSDTPWTVGRGDFGLADSDFLRGDIDEVRISRAVLPTSQFLNSAGGVAVVNPTVSVSPNYTSVYPAANVVFTATATSNMSGTITYQWYKDGAPLSGETAATLTRSAVTLGSNGVYSVAVTDSVTGPGGSALTTTASARLRVLDVPAAGVARAIGLNFVGAGSGTSSTELGILSASQSAGIYAMTNWNNSASVTGVAVQSTPLALTESNASAAAAVTAVWSSVNTWSARKETGLVANKTPDALLLHGYIESRLAAGSSVTVSNIPYASYDVYVHVAGGADGEVGSLKINREGAPTYYYRVFQNGSATATATPYTVPTVMGESLTRSDAVIMPAATFVRFAGVTGSDLTITAADQTLNKNAGGIAAIEIVDRSPPGAAYPVIVTGAPVPKLAQGGANVSFGVTAVSQNSGTLTYQWKKDGADLPGKTAATLSLTNVTGASSGNYTVTVTDTSGLGTVTTSRTASLVVVDATRPLLINGDINAAASPTFVGNGILRTTGTDTTNLGTSNGSTTVWNGVLGAAGTATRSLTKESTGLTLSGVSFTYAGAEGVEDNTAAGFISTSVALPLIRDYLYTDNQATPLTGTISGLDAFVGQQVTLVVYAYGKLSTAFSETTTSDTATVTLASASNHLGTAPQATSTWHTEYSGEQAGRDPVINNPDATGGNSSAYVTFTGVVAPGGTVSWSIGPDSDAGRIPLVGFQLLISGTSLAPAVPTGLAAVAGNNQVTLNWTTSSGANTYTIGRSTVSGGPYTTISAGAVTGASYTDSTAVNGTTYYYVVASAKTSPAVQSAFSAQVSATPVNGTTALQGWRQTYFSTTANSGSAANGADPDGDGLVNLLEYALGTNPTVPGVSSVVLGQSGGALTLTFSPVVDASLSYVIEASSDLAGGWSLVHTYGAFASTAPVTYTDSVVLSGANSKRFLRLKVTSSE